MAIGNKGKFSERLKRILFFRKRKKDVHNEKIEFEDSGKIYTNFLKVVAAVPGLVYGNMVNETKKDVSIHSPLNTDEPKQINVLKKSEISDLEKNENKAINQKTQS